MSLPELRDFEARVGASFELSGGPEGLSFEVELLSATKLSVGPYAPGARQGFSLLFRGPAEHKLPQSIRSLSHEQLGEFSLFLVPVKEDDAGRYYEAIVN